MNFSNTNLNSEPIKKKFSIPVTIVEEKSVDIPIDDQKAEEILRTTSNQHFYKDNHLIMKIDDDKIHFKNGRKWFQKFKEFKLSLHLKSYFIHEDFENKILFYIQIKNFQGYFVLQIELALNMRDFRENLKNSSVVRPNFLSHRNAIPNLIENTNGSYENNNNNIEMNNFTGNNVNEIDHPVDSHSTNYTLDMSLNDVESLTNHSVEPAIINTDLNQQFPYKNKTSKIQPYYINKNDYDKITLIDLDCDQVVTNDGPVALYSQSFPSLLSTQEGETYRYHGEVESDDEYDTSLEINYNKWYQ